jgi:hypothetical protein
MKIFVGFIKQACLRASYVVYANAHTSINSLYHFSSYENICLSYKTSLLACLLAIICNHFQIGGG